jgi:hypothetical protein
VLLGRARELELLGSAYAGAVKGRPFAVLIEGDPGIGKTALLRTFLSGLADEAHVLLATADEGEQDRPFALFHQLVVGTDGVLARRFADVVAGRTAPPEALAAGVDLLAEIGRLQVDGQPVVIALDDVHWADRPSLGSLVFALRRLRVDNVLAVMTIRSGEGTRLPAGLLRLASDPTGFSLPVGGLAMADLETLGSTVSTVPLTPRTARRLHEATAGNPLYAMTLLRELGPQSLDDDRPLPLPPSLTLLLLARLSGCGQPSIRLVQAVSILGGRPYLAIVAQLAALDDPHAAFEEAEHAGLLARDHVDPQRVEFSHPLIRAAIYSDLSVSTRSALHRRAAAVTSGETALEHRVRASGSVDRALAEELRSLASAEAAEGRWGSAGRHLIASSRLHPSAEVREASLLRAAVMLAAGPDPGAVAALEDEVRQQPPSAWRGFILAHLAMSAGHVGEATTRLEDALDRSDPDQEPEIVAITAFLLAACRLLQGGRGRETAELSRLALRLAPVGSPARLAWVTVLYGEAIAGRPTAALKMVPDL